jgi:hypothetical protein
MTSSAYRIKIPITVVLRQADHYRLIQLCSDSVFLTTGSKPDANGMIDGTCGNDIVLIFARDLEDRAERIAAVSGSLCIQRRQNVCQS